MSADKPLLIVNPNAGGGKAKRLFPEIEPVVIRALGAVDVAFTERAGHGIDLARDAARDGRPLVIALGGDGSFNEIVNGVMTGGEPTTKTAVGFIGQGTGGDFRRTLDVEHRLDKYLEALASGRTRPVDVGRIKYRDHDGKPAERYFVNVMSIGMGGLAVRYVADASRVLGPTLTYYGAALRALVNIDRGRLRARITEDGKTREEEIATYVIAVCNGRYLGAGMHMAPMAKIDDGRFEVVSIGMENKLAFFAAMSLSVYEGKHLEKQGTTHFGCQRLELELLNARDAEKTFLIDCDGEPIGGLPLDVEVVPRAITLRA